MGGNGAVPGARYGLGVLDPEDVAARLVGKVESAVVHMVEGVGEGHSGLPELLQGLVKRGAVVKARPDLAPESAVVEDSLRASVEGVGHPGVLGVHKTRELLERGGAGVKDQALTGGEVDVPHAIVGVDDADVELLRELLDKEIALVNEIIRCSVGVPDIGPDLPHLLVEAVDLLQHVVGLGDVAVKGCLDGLKVLLHLASHIGKRLGEALELVEKIDACRRGRRIVVGVLDRRENAADAVSEGGALAAQELVS